MWAVVGSHELAQHPLFDATVHILNVDFAARMKSGNATDTPARRLRTLLREATRLHDGTALQHLHARRHEAHTRWLRRVWLGAFGASPFVIGKLKLVEAAMHIWQGTAIGAT